MGSGQAQSGQATKLFHVPRKTSFTVHFLHNSFILDDVKLALLSRNSFEWKNVTFLEDQNTPSYVFSGGQDPPNPHDLAIFRAFGEKGGTWATEEAVRIILVIIQITLRQGYG